MLRTRFQIGESSATRKNLKRVTMFANRRNETGRKHPSTYPTTNVKFLRLEKEVSSVYSCTNCHMHVEAHGRETQKAYPAQLQHSEFSSLDFPAHHHGTLMRWLGSQRPQPDFRRVRTLRACVSPALSWEAVMACSSLDTVCACSRPCFKCCDRDCAAARRASSWTSANPNLPSTSVALSVSLNNKGRNKKRTEGVNSSDTLHFFF